MATKWGICGTGKIANDFCASLKSLPETEHQIVAVAAGSSKEKAEEFAQRFGIPTSYGCYDDLIQDKNVDAVYVSVIHNLHAELSLKSINAGKAVLCEKPMAVSLEGCHKVLQAAKDKQVLYVEAFWNRFFPATAYLKEQLESGILGEIKTVSANLCVPINDLPRTNSTKLGGGSLMDVGCYPVQAANLVFNNEKPEKICCSGWVDPEHGVDRNCAIVLTYKGGRHAILHYSEETQYACNDMVIRGTKGTIRLPDFVEPYKVEVNGEMKEFPIPPVQYKMNFSQAAGLSYEAQGVRHCLLNGLKESPHIPHADSEAIFTIMQEVLDQLGVKYDVL